MLWSGASPEKNSLGPFTFGYPPLLALKTRTIIQLQGTRPQHRPRNRSSDQDDRKPNFAQPRSQPRMLAAQLSEAQIDRDSRNQVPPLSLERSEDAQEAKLLAGRMGGPGIERRWLRRAARPQPEKSFAYDGHRISQNSIGELLQMGVNEHYAGDCELLARSHRLALQRSADCRKSNPSVYISNDLVQDAPRESVRAASTPKHR